MISLCQGIPPSSLLATEWKQKRIFLTLQSMRKSINKSGNTHLPIHNSICVCVCWCVCVCVMTWSGVGVTPTTFAWWLLLLPLPLRLFIHSSQLTEWNDSWSKKKSGSAWLAHVIGLRRDAMKPTLPAGIENAARAICMPRSKRKRERERGEKGKQTRGSSCWCMTWLLDEPIVVDRFMNSLWSVRSLMTSQASRKTHMQLSAGLLFRQRPSAIGSYYNAVMKPEHTQLRRRQIQRYIDTKIQRYRFIEGLPTSYLRAFSVLAEAFLCV